jgi:hypothetical protein
VLCSVGEFSGLDDLAGDLVKLDVLVLRDASGCAEGGIWVDLVPLHDDAFGLADNIAVDQGGPEMVGSLGLSQRQRGQRGSCRRSLRQIRVCSRAASIQGPCPVSNGYPWNGRYIVASGNLLADFRADAAAEAQGRPQTARLYNMTDDNGVRDMLRFNLARDSLHQNLWLKAIEELQADGLETTVAPNALFDEEYAEHATSVWHLSDGTHGHHGCWASELQPNGTHEFDYLVDAQPLGDAASVPAPTRNCMPPTTAPWASPPVRRLAPRPAWPGRSRTS